MVLSTKSLKDFWIGFLITAENKLCGTNNFMILTCFVQQGTFLQVNIKNPVTLRREYCKNGNWFLGFMTTDYTTLLKIIIIQSKPVSLMVLFTDWGRSISIKMRLFHYHLNVPSGTVCLNTSTNAGIWNTTLQVKGSWFQNPVVDFCSVLLSVMFAEVHWKERDVFLS